MQRLAVAVCLLALTAGCIGAVPEGDDAVGGDGATDGPFDDPGGDGELAVHAIDVGQADATLVVGPAGDTMLIDTGGWQDDGETVIEYLEARGVQRLDYLVSTHAHADHVGGAAAVIDHYETRRDGVGAVYDSGVTHTSQTYDRYLDAIEEHDVTLYRTQAGDEIDLEEAHVAVLNPPAERESDDLHDNGVAVRVAHGDAAFLFTGDAERDRERELVDRYGDGLDATGLQAGHHGSDTSNSAAFLDAVDPSFVVVSAAYDSTYGHPHDEVLDRLDERGADVYWTGVHGTIVAVSDGSDVTVATAAAATTDPAAIDGANEAGTEPTAPVEERATYEASATATPAAAPLGAVAVRPADGHAGVSGGAAA